MGENCFEMVIKRGLKIFPNGDEAGLKFGPKWDVNVSESALMLTDCWLITMETSIREEEGERLCITNANTVETHKYKYSRNTNTKLHAVSRPVVTDFH